MSTPLAPLKSSLLLVFTSLLLPLPAFAQSLTNQPTNQSLSAGYAESFISTLQLSPPTFPDFSRWDDVIVSIPGDAFEYRQCLFWQYDNDGVPVVWCGETRPSYHRVESDYVFPGHFLNGGYGL